MNIQKYIVFHLLLLLITRVESNQDHRYKVNALQFPDYFQIKDHYESPKDYSGFYQKTTAVKEDSPVYEKPKVSQYLFVHKRLWTISASKNIELEDGYIANLEGKCDLPTSAVCNKKWIEKLHGQIVQLEVIEEPKPNYPDYYEVTAKSSVTGKHPDLLGFYKKEPTMFKNFPAFKKAKTTSIRYSVPYYLYLHDKGQWTINGYLGYGQGYIKSKTKGHPSPPNNEGWEYWNDKEWVEDKTISVKPVIYIILQS